MTRVNTHPAKESISMCTGVISLIASGLLNAKTSPRMHTTETYAARRVTDARK